MAKTTTKSTTVKPVVKSNLSPADLELARLKEKLATGKKPNKADLFPIVSVMDQADMDEVIELMKADISYAEQEESIKEAREYLKTELGNFIGKYPELVKAGGTRHGQLAVYYNPASSKRTLNKELLLINGVKAEVIAASYKSSEPKVSVRVADLSKPRKSNWNGGEDD